MNAKTEKQLRRVLKQFNINSLFKTVLPYFYEWVTYESIVSEIRRLKYTTSEQSVVDVFLNLLKNSDINNADIEEKLPICMLFGVGFNSSQKTWTTYALEGSVTYDKSEEELEADLKHSLLQSGLHATVVVKCIDSLHWLQVVEKKLIKNRLKIYAPFYVAHFIEEPYIFLSKSGVSEELLQSLSEGFGYSGYKFSNLSGHHLDSLLQHSKQKGIKRGHALPIPSVNNFKVTPWGLDFSQHDERRKYVSNLMGSSPPKLSNYVVLAKNLPWKGKLYQQKMRTKTFDMKIEFKTEDTVELLKDMAECSALKVPPPSYVVNLLSTGRNNIKVRAQANMATDTENQTDA